MNVARSFIAELVHHLAAELEAAQSQLEAAEDDEDLTYVATARGIIERLAARARSCATMLDVAIRTEAEERRRDQDAAAARIAAARGRK